MPKNATGSHNDAPNAKQRRKAKKPDTKPARPRGDTVRRFAAPRGARG
jgi:hypothetical protein